DMFNAFLHPRATRPELPLLDRAQCQQYLDLVRRQALEALTRADFNAANPLTHDGYIFRMLIQHEYQHDETMLATLQLMDAPGYRPRLPRTRRAAAPVPEMVFVDAGPFVMGTDDRTRAYDNERPAHVFDLPAYWIDRGPGT